MSKKKHNKFEEGGMVIHIERGIEMPPSASDKTKKFAEALSSMDIGDSFLLSYENRNFITYMTRRHADRLPIGIEFTSRKIDDKTRRVWRTN